jgi:hypothetical protein
MASVLDAWIYRDGRERTRGADASAAVGELVAELEGATGDRARQRSVEALISCGELEAALADAAEPGAIVLASITDALAVAALGARCDTRALLERLSHVVMPREVTISVTEGFAYYALHPEAYALAACAASPPGREVLLVGVRSIGTTLSAMALAALTSRGDRASRITVRPRGEPYERRLDLDDEQLASVRRARDDGASVLVLDEGPGMSGSTFLATAEAVAAAGIPEERITLVCSHEPPLEALVARDAAARFRRFAMAVVPADVRVPRGIVELSAGVWRSHAYDDEGLWPASFIQTERRKVLLPGGRLAKFEGMGRVGRAARERASLLAGAALAPEPHDEGDGWLSTPWAGRPLAATDLDVRVLDHLAMACAKRAALFAGGTACADLEAMVEKNLRLTRGSVRAPVLPVERLCVTDGRMAPHEWLRREDGSLVKCDAIAHGDDHFFPGPTDIAWDLAGVVVEWGLDAQAVERLLATYECASGDDARSRLGAWIVAYSAFRLAFTEVGKRAATTPGEHARLARDAQRYRSLVAP